MIITCANCNKKFNIDQKLIPSSGRLLQCSSCNHKWHYIIPKIENEIIQNIKLPEKTINTSEVIDKNISINQQSLRKKNTTQKVNKNIYANRNLQLNNKTIRKNISLGNLLNNLIIIFITFIALILILDTFKTSISNYLPILMPLLDSLYQSLSDMRFFIKDLLT